MKPRKIWHPPDYDVTIIRAMQGLAEGTASPDMQKRALDWIINSAALTYDEPFQPGQTDVVNYVLGRRSVGLAIVKMLKLKPELFREKEKATND